MSSLPLLTERQVRAAATRAGAARKQIEKTVRSGAIELDHKFFWGQWLRGPRSHQQKGVYGTAAGIEILMTAGDSADRPPVSSAIAGLPLVGDNESYDAADIGLTFKVVAIVDACSATSDRLDMEHLAVQRLVEMNVDGRGWSGYWAEGVQALEPNPVVTACALRALNAVSGWRDHPSCRASLFWLADQLETGGNDQVADSLGLLALNLYRDIGSEDERWTSGHAAAEKRVELIIRRDLKAHDFSSQPFHYEVDLDRPENKYMFFMPAVIGALAILSGRSGQRIRLGPSIVKLIDAASTLIEKNGGLMPQGQRLATVDQLWATRLLLQYSKLAQDPTRFLPKPRSVVTGGVKWLVAPVLVTVAVVGFAYAAENPVTPKQIIGSIVSGLALNLLASMLMRGSD